MMRGRLGAAVLWLGLVAITGAGCKKKAASPSGPAPELTGLAAIPATAQVMIAADVSKLSGSAIVARAVERLLLTDAKLAEGWQHVQETCKLDLPKQIKRVMLALGPPAAGAQPGTGPVLMVATGTLAENDLATCVRTMVGKGGGTLTAKPADGRTLYQVKDGNRTMFFAFGRADTVVLGTSEPFVLEALSGGKKALDNPEMKSWIGLADQNAPVWAAGKVPDLVKSGLVGVSDGKLKAGPTAIVASLDPSDGAKLELGVLMATSEDAKALESFANTELKVLTMVAQTKSLGGVVAKITLASDGTLVRFRAPLTMAEVNQLLSLLDEDAGHAQGSPPSNGPGPSGGSGSDSTSK